MNALDMFQELLYVLISWYIVTPFFSICYECHCLKHRSINMKFEMSKKCPKKCYMLSLLKTLFKNMLWMSKKCPKKYYAFIAWNKNMLWMSKRRPKKCYMLSLLETLFKNMLWMSKKCPKKYYAFTAWNKNMLLMSKRRPKKCYMLSLLF